MGPGDRQHTATQSLTMTTPLPSQWCSDLQDVGDVDICHVKLESVSVSDRITGLILNISPRMFV